MQTIDKVLNVVLGTLIFTYTGAVIFRSWVYEKLGR